MERETIVAIDPKLIGSGYAIGTPRRLLTVGLARVPSTMRDLEGRIETQIGIIHAAATGPIDTVIAEFPFVYPKGDQFDNEYANIDPNDIVRLAGLACGIAAGLNPARLLLPLPREWKGTIPKKIHHARLAQAHSRAVPMVQAVRPPSMRHDVWDAVGLWAWYVEQCELGA